MALARLAARRVRETLYLLRQFLTERRFAPFPRNCFTSPDKPGQAGRVTGLDKSIAFG